MGERPTFWTLLVRVWKISNSSINNRETRPDLCIPKQLWKYRDCSQRYLLFSHFPGLDILTHANGKKQNIYVDIFPAVCKHQTSPIFPNSSSPSTTLLTLLKLFVSFDIQMTINNSFSCNYLPSLDRNKYLWGFFFSIILSFGMKHCLWVLNCRLSDTNLDIHQQEVPNQSRNI